MILVDTPIWSLAYRRKPAALSRQEMQLVDELRLRADEDQVALIGPIRFEVLSGIRDPSRFEKVRGYLAAFRLIPLEPETYDLAAEFYNRCRAAGVAPGGIDMVIAAAAVESESAVFTTDRDFERYARHLPMRLHAI